MLGAHRLSSNSLLPENVSCKIFLESTAWTVVLQAATQLVISECGQSI